MPMVGLLPLVIARTDQKRDIHMEATTSTKTMTPIVNSFVGDNAHGFQAFDGHLPLHCQGKECNNSVEENRCDDGDCDGDGDDGGDGYDTDNSSTCTNPRLKKLMDRYFPSDCDADDEFYNSQHPQDLNIDERCPPEAKGSEKSRKRRLKRRRHKRKQLNQSDSEASDEDIATNRPTLYMQYDDSHLSPTPHVSSTRVLSPMSSLDMNDLYIEKTESVVTKVDFVGEKSPFLNVGKRAMMNDDISDVARYFNFSLSDHNDSFSEPAYTNHAIEFEADILADIELTERARQMQHDLRLREMEELAVEAEKAAEAGEEKFVGSATKFGGDTCISSLPSFITNHSMVPIARNSSAHSHSRSEHEKAKKELEQATNHQPEVLKRSQSCIEIGEQHSTNIVREAPLALPPSVKRLSSQTVVEKPSRLSAADRHVSAPDHLPSDRHTTHIERKALSPISDRLFSHSSSSYHSDEDQIGEIASAPSKLNQDGRQDHFLQVQTTISATFTASSFLSPSFQVKRIRVLSLRHIEEVVPSFGEMHQQLHAHLKRSGVKTKDTSNSLVDDTRAEYDAESKNQDGKRRRGSLSGLTSFLPRAPSLQKIFSNMSGSNKEETDHVLSSDQNSPDLPLITNSKVNIPMLGPDDSFDCASFVSCDGTLEQQIVVTPLRKDRKIKQESPSSDSPKKNYMSVLASEIIPRGFNRSPSPLPSAPYEFDTDSDTEAILHPQQQLLTASPWTTFWKNISPSKKNLFIPNPMKLSRSSTTGSLPWMVALTKTETTGTVGNRKEGKELQKSELSPIKLHKRTNMLSSRSLPSPFATPQDSNEIRVEQTSSFKADSSNDSDDMESHAKEDEQRFIAQLVADENDYGVCHTSSSLVVDESTFDCSPNVSITEEIPGVDPNTSITSASRFIDFIENVPAVMDRLSPLLVHRNPPKKKEEYEDDVAFVGNYFYVAEDPNDDAEVYNSPHTHEHERATLCGRQSCNEASCADIGISMIETILAEDKPPNLTLNDASPDRVQWGQNVFTPCTGVVVEQPLRGRVKAGNRFYQAPTLQVKKGGIFSGRGVMGSHDFDDEFESNRSDDIKLPSYLSSHQEESNISPIHEDLELRSNNVDNIEVFPFQYRRRGRESKDRMVETCKSMLSFSDEELQFEPAKDS